MGNTALGQDFYLAPFLDFDGDGFYDPTLGDYPWYDFLQEIDCKNRRREDAVPLYGDQQLLLDLQRQGQRALRVPGRAHRHGNPCSGLSRSRRTTRSTT